MEARGGSLPVPTRLTVPSDVLRATLKALPKGLAAGLSIGTFETIQSIFNHDDAELLTGVVERLLNGETSEAARSFLTAAKLVALRKPNGKIRPIAMGDALRRLAMQVICRMRKEKFDTYFTSPLLVEPQTGQTSPDGGEDSADPEDDMASRLWVAGIALQLGVGTSGGTEIAAHLICTHLENHPNDAAFKNDFKNAFNAMSRRQLVRLLLLLTAHSPT